VTTFEQVARQSDGHEGWEDDYEPSPLAPSGNLRRRQAVSRLAESVATAAAVLAVVVLGLVLYTVISRGAPVLSLSFLTSAPPAVPGISGGGIGPEIVGTAVIVLVATVISMPIAILVALFVTEYATSSAARVIKLALDVLNGIPSIVLGIFVFGLIVVRIHHQAAIAGSLALGILMLPVIARAAQEILLRIPPTIREGTDALGVRRWRSTLTVILPAAVGGILTATVLALARAAGETAPLLFVSSVYDPSQTSINLFGQALPNIPVYIFTVAEDADPTGYARAWGAAFVLMAFILVVNIAARALHSRTNAARYR